MTNRPSYPEIETRAVARNDKVRQIFSKYKPPATLVDLLEIGRIPKAKAIWKEGLDHTSLLAHFRSAGSRDPGFSGAPVLRVLFLGTIRSRSAGAEILDQLKVNQCARLHPSTVEWMRDRFDVSPIFLDCLTFGHTVLKTGCISFLKRDNKGKVVAIDGFYRFSFGFADGVSHAWFSHDVVKRSSTYILDNCPSTTKNFIQQCAFGKHADTLGRPCAIDSFIAEDCGQSWGEEMLVFRNELIQYEKMRTASQSLSPADMAGAVENLHYLSQNLHVISEDITDLEERLEFLRGVHAKYLEYSPGVQGQESVAESLQFIASRTRIWKRWAMNYKDRVQIRINLFFNLASQNDNRTNLEIASFTSKIAVDTRRDSSSMITIAAVTMFFLPGTFVSALFSMVFFDSGTDQNGRTTITVAPQWWYFAAITVPLTVVVFFVWVLWQRWRNHVNEIGHTDNVREKD